VQRVWATRDVRVAGSAAEALRLTLLPDVVPGSAVVLEGGNVPHFPAAAKLQQSYRVLAYTPQRMIAEVTVSAPAVAVFAEAYYPGWHALVDGQEVPLYRADYYLRAVEVPSGTHQVEFSFDPVSFKVGAAVSLASALAAVLAVCLARRRRGIGQPPP